MKAIDDDDLDRPVPALFNYAYKVYICMRDRAEQEPVPDSEEDIPETQLVYTGHLTSLFQDLGVPNPYYSAVMRYLRMMGCAQQIQRGGGTAHSKWLLVAEPTAEAFMGIDSSQVKGHKTGIVKSLQQQVSGLALRINVLEDEIALLKSGGMRPYSNK